MGCRRAERGVQQEHSYVMRLVEISSTYLDVASTNVQSYNDISWLAKEALVVKLEIGVEQSVWINALLDHAFPIRMIAETAENRIVYL